jgi:Na+/H+-dicarboxylate symporter
MVSYAIGVLLLYGGAIEFGAFTEYILMLTVIAVASPGVPGGVVLASAAILETALGFTPERYALMVAMYMALDGMGTACNLTGDGAIAMVVDKFRGDAKEPS